MTSLAAGAFAVCVGSAGALCGIAAALFFHQFSFVPSVPGWKGKAPNMNKADAHSNKHNRVLLLISGLSVLASALYSSYSMSASDGASTMGAFFKTFLATFLVCSLVMLLYRAN